MFWNQGIWLFLVRTAAFSVIIAHFFHVPAWLSALLGGGLALASHVFWRCRR